MNPLSSYYDQQILSAEPVELIRMLYRKALALVHDARRHLVTGDVVERSRSIMRTYDILQELIGALRDDVAPELCARLRGLYTYMQQRLIEGNMEQKDEPLGEVWQLLRTLSEAWVGAPLNESATTREMHAYAA